MPVIGRVISGGQTGADLGALKGARAAGVPTGGTAPRGFMTERGPRPHVLRGFGLRANASRTYARRTAANIAAADATLLLGARLDRGSRLTLALCRRRRKPHRRVARFSEAEIAATGAWLRDDHRRKGGPLTLNVAGPRESRAPGIEARAERFVVRLLTRLSRS